MLSGYAKIPGVGGIVIALIVIAAAYFKTDVPRELPLEIVRGDIDDTLGTNSDSVADLRMLVEMTERATKATGDRAEKAKLETEARRQAEESNRLRAEEETRLEAEAKRQAEESNRLRAEEETRLEGETKRQAEVVARRKARVKPMAGLYLVLEYTNVRTGPFTPTKKLGVLSPGTKVTVTGKVRDVNWYQVRYHDGIGYVYGTLLRKTENAERTE